MHEEAAGIRKGPSGLAAATASGAATLHPHEAGLLLQDPASHNLGQLLRVAPRVGGHLHPGAGQPPEHLLRAAALPKQLRVPPARPAQQTPAERRVGSGQSGRQRDRQIWRVRERTNKWRKTKRQMAKKDGEETDR